MEASYHMDVAVHPAMKQGTNGERVSPKRYGTTARHGTGWRAPLHAIHKCRAHPVMQQGLASRLFKESSH